MYMNGITGQRKTATGNGVKGNSFVDVRTGIKAQVQHLKAYASVEPLNATQVVDERFKYVTRNAAPYVEWLGIKENPTGKGWAVAAGYGFNLMKIVNNLQKCRKSRDKISKNDIQFLLFWDNQWSYVKIQYKLK